MTTICSTKPIRFAVIVALALGSLAASGCGTEEDYQAWKKSDIASHHQAVYPIIGYDCYDVFYYYAHCGDVTGKGSTRAAAMESIAETVYGSNCGVSFTSGYETVCDPIYGTRIYSKGGTIDITY